ncbi:MAG: beta-ketoacyl synthase N-terminal-like domain-containing protein [Luteolibacter sp.]
MISQTPLSISGLGAFSALGEGMDAHLEAVRAGHVPFRPLGELLGADSPHAARPGAWIENRAALTHRKWSPVTMAALNAARQAVKEAGWTGDDLRDAALVVGTSRGNAAGWLGPWPGRRPFKLMAASNTIHSEPCTAISVEFGISGPNHVVASGCAAGLDAVGLAMLLVQSGQAEKALAVAVDLPLVPLLLDNYAASGLLSPAFSLNPYHPRTSGFVPGEGAAAMALEATVSENQPKALFYACNSDACDPVGIPADGGRTPDLLKRVRDAFGEISAVCPHATGTAVQSVADPAAFRKAFSEKMPTLHLLKPFTGHTIGASGLLESVILTGFLRGGEIAPNLPGLHAPEGIVLPDRTLAARGLIVKLSHGMGGHNSLLVLSPP